jgi:uncharacterized integral membrane protein
MIALRRQSGSYGRRMAEERPERSKQDRTFTGKVVLWVVVAVLVLILILQNNRDVRVDLYAWDVTVSLWVLLLGTLLVGMFLGWGLPKLRRGRRDRDED